MRKDEKHIEKLELREKRERKDGEKEKIGEGDGCERETERERAFEHDSWFYTVHCGGVHNN